MLALLVALLAQPAPAPLPVRAELQAYTLVVTWAPPQGQAVACLERANGQALDCVIGTGGRLQLGPGSLSEEQRLTAGDGVRVRVWAVGGAELARGQAQVFGRTRYLPMVLEGRLRGR